MKRKISIGAALAIMLIGVLITFQITMLSIDKQYAQTLAEITAGQVNYQKLSSIDKIVRRNFVNQIDEETLENELITGYFKGLGDKYSYYMTPDEYAVYQSSLNSRMVGIGITANYDIENDAIAIYSVLPFSPAAENGLLAGDLIIAVDSQFVSDIGYHNAINMISGEAGTSCTLTVLTGEDHKQEIVVQVTRAEIESQSVTWRMIDNQIAYIAISEFNNTTSSQFASVINEVISSQAKAIIYDVRSNPGGDLNGVQGVLDRILPEGPIIRMYNSAGEETVLQSDAKSVSLPSATLINMATASAAELFAAALKDYDMTTLVGEKTYGKGSVQTVITLPDKSGFVISTAMYSPPKSQSIDQIGVKPDVEVKQDMQSISYIADIENDSQLKKAIEILSTNN